MAGYVIHLAIAEEYLKLHKDNDYSEFIAGVIFPDSVFPKSITHFGKSPAYTNLGEFLKVNNIDSSYMRGYFLHLVTDYLFYNYYLNVYSKQIVYRDYDILNDLLIKKYNVKLPEAIKGSVSFIKGDTQILHFDLACKIIDEISKLDLDKIAIEAKNNDKKWNQYKNLV